MCQQNNCGCSQTTVTTSNCSSCPPEPCACPVKITTDCSTYTGDTLACSGIEKDTILTDVIQQLDGFICDTKDQLYNAFSLVNIGTGSQVYKGVDGIGRKELRTIKSINPDLTITQTATEIQLDVDIPVIDGSETKVTAGTNTTVSGTGTISSPYVVNATSPDGTETKLVNGTATTITGNGSIATPYAVNVNIDGTETKVTAGTNITVSGNGTLVNPYIINSTGGSSAPDATDLVKGILKLTNDLGGTADLPTTPTAIHKTGNESWTGQKSGSNLLGGVPTILQVINNSTITSGTAVDFTSSDVSNSNLLTLNLQSTLGGTGLLIKNTTASIEIPIVIKNNGVNTYTVDKLGNITANSFIKTGGTAQQILIANGTVRELNPQKEIITNYTLTDADDGYVIFINNSTTPISITINSSVTIPNFSVGFIQEGSADVTFVGTGITLTNPIGLKSKGQGYQTFIERKLSTSTYYLLGNTRA